MTRKYNLTMSSERPNNSYQPKITFENEGEAKIGTNDIFSKMI